MKETFLFFLQYHVASFFRYSFILLAFVYQANVFALPDRKLNIVDLNNWQQIEEKAKGQTLYFHAWGGSPEVNGYLQWVKKELQADYGIILQHVKVADISETIQRLLSEKVAGKKQAGQVDLLWVNGENFASLKSQSLLFGPFVEALPHWDLVDQSLPVSQDFSTATEGLEAPWGVGQLVLIYDEKKLKHPPENAKELLEYAKKHPNRLSYPKPPEFHGVSFLKSLLIELTGQDAKLQSPLISDDYQKLTQPLWDYLDAFHPVAWRYGKQFPATSAETLQLLDDSEIDLAISFNPNVVQAAKQSGQLAETTKAYTFSKGALTNIHFLAIPHNASAKEGALVAINFLLSPKAQSRKGDPTLWGDPSVLKNDALKGAAKANSLFTPIAEIHPSWQLAIEQDWLKRYGH